MRPLLSLLVFAVFADLAHAAHRCPTLLASTQYLGPVDYSLDELRREVNKSSLSPWKKMVLIKLFEKEAEAGHRIIDFNNNLISMARNNFVGGRIPLPYVPGAVRDIRDGVIAVARSQGLPAADRYIVLPLKIIAANGIKRFWSHAFMVLALGATGNLFGWLGVNVSNPLVEETDPDELEEDENIIIVKLDSTKIREADQNAASYLDGSMVKELHEKSPQKIRVLDLSKENGVNNEAEAIKKVNEIVNSFPKGSKTKKIILTGHGTMGSVESDSMGLITLAKLSEVLAPLKRILPSSKVDTFFTSCLLAGNEAGRTEVRNFASTLLPQGSKIQVNNLLGYAGNEPASMELHGLKIDGTFEKNSPSKLPQKIFTLLNPAAAEPLQIASDFYRLFQERMKNVSETPSADADLWLKKSKYNFVVPKEKN